MQCNIAAVCLVVIVVLGFISITESQKNVAKKQQFRGNINYQHFLELDQKRKLRLSNELERTQKRSNPFSAAATTKSPRTTSTTRTTTTTTTATTTTTTTTTERPSTAAPINSRRFRTRMSANYTEPIAAAAAPVPSRSSTREVIRRKKKANIHLDSDNEIKSRDEERRQEEDEEQNKEQVNNQRFLSPSVRKYLALGRAIPGRPGTDYPILSQVPYTNFYCDDQEFPGFFADMETRCQGWHYCDIDGRQATFLCPNGTQFSQAVFVCDWWFNVPCDLSPKLYSLNARLYQRPKKTSTPPTPHRVISKLLIDQMFN